jgi:chromosome segregation protein
LGLLLRKLEAYGFKSFAEKTEMEFKSGITAIVGPNGSGKSNISDAVRWVLGEQNIRNLRGNKMEDVIFSGSAMRRPLGVAEVSLVFDNTDGLLPLDFNEVTITRRVFRSGDGEYFINKAPCRLKDIHDLLLDAGLSRESMTVISQNKIDEVLNSKPDERRSLFEEAAGIVKYKNRKKEALRKLEDTEQNLTRVLDITAEIETQLGPMAESAERTAKYNDLFAEQTACQVTLLLHRLSHAEKNLESVTLERAALADEDLAVATRLTVAETDKERFVDTLAELDEKVRDAEAALAHTATEIERLDGKTGILAERLDQERKNRDRVAQDIARIEQEKAENRARLEEWQASHTAKKNQAEELRASQAGQDAALTQAAAAIAAALHRLEAAKDETFGHLQELVTQKNALRTLERDQETQKTREAQLGKERESFAGQHQETSQSLGSVQWEKQALDQDLAATDTTAADLAARKRELDALLSEHTAAETRLNGELGQLASRIKVLGDMQEEYEGFGRGAKSVLKSDRPWRQGIHGAVAEVLTVRDAHIVAIETALGGALQHIIVASDDTAKAAVEYLKHNNLGRATFLPLNTIRPARPKDAETAAAHSQGALGFAASLVECEPRFRPVIDYLLARTVVAADIDAALKIARAAAFGVKIVTLDGQLINPGGSITGGSVGRREASFLGRSGEIAALRERFTTRENDLAAHRRQTAEIQTEAAALEEKIAAAQGRRRTLEVRQAELAVHAENTGAEIKRLDLALATIEAELAASRGEAAAIVARIAETAAAIAAMEQRDSEHKRRIAAWQNELRKLQADRETIAGSLTDSKIKLSALEQEVNAIAVNCEQYLQAEGRLNRQVASLRADNDRVAEDIARAEADLAALAQAKETLAAEKTAREKDRDAVLKDKLGILAKQAKLEREVKDLRRRQNNCQARLHELDLLAAKFGFEVTSCTDQLRDHFALDREQAQALFRPEDPEILAARADELAASIEELGPVNPAAIEEYARLKERYQFLRTQYDDLTAAKDYLLTILKDIDTTMAKQFKAAFLKINEHFGDLFVRLFGGGRAQLELDNPADILGTGIEIIVQPPGKKQQNLALLSGGERALTVIALLFAFLTYRPTPFCVLDEIDAALDEANVQRFSEFLQDYARSTQFIVVTHRKGTMEAADVMHGVTMEESGVSRLISVKFMDKAG